MYLSTIVQFNDLKSDRIPLALESIQCYAPGVMGSQSVVICKVQGRDINPEDASARKQVASMLRGFAEALESEK